MNADNMRHYAQRIEALRIDLLCEGDVPIASRPLSSMSPEAESYVVLTLDALSQAKQFMTLASYRQMKGE